MGSTDEPNHCVICESDVVCQTSCDCCGDGICSACDTSITFKATFLSYKCSVCPNILCENCYVFCHQCLRDVGTAVGYCGYCRPIDLEEVECQDASHLWMNCGKHVNKLCGECNPGSSKLH